MLRTIKYSPRIAATEALRFCEGGAKIPFDTIMIMILCTRGSTRMFLYASETVLVDWYSGNSATMYSALAQQNL